MPAKRAAPRARVADETDDTVAAESEEEGQQTEEVEAPTTATDAPSPPRSDPMAGFERRGVIGLTNRNGVRLANGKHATIRLGQMTTLPADVAKELVNAGLVAYT